MKLKIAENYPWLGKRVKNTPILSGRWVSAVFLVFLFLNLSYTPTSRHRKDTGAIIVGIIGAIQVRE
jgi:hypothetical protein